MNDVVSVFQFVMSLATSWISFFMSNWVTSLFVFGSIILLVINLITVNNDDK